MKRFVPILFVVGILAVAEDVAAQSTMTATADLITRMNTLDPQIIAGLSELRTHASDIAEFIRQDKIRNMEKKKHPLDPWKKWSLYFERDLRWGKFYEKFPAASLLYAFNDSVGSSVPGIENAIAGAIKTIGDSAQKCFPNGSKFNSANMACKRQLAQCNTHTTWGAKLGIMYIPVLDQNLDSENKIINEFKDVWPSTAPSADMADKSFMNLFERKFVFCKLASLVGQDFEPKSAIPPDPPPAWAEFIPDDDNASKPMAYEQKYCVDAKPSAAILAKLALYSNDPFDEWRFIVSANLKQCNVLIGIFCRDSYVVKDKVILTYPTVGCEIREVTREDVEKDLDNWRNDGITEADILNHSTLLDTIDLCQAASNAGYVWDYKKPSLGKDCHKQKQKKRGST